jgi:TRAP-type mannitol/chloroaromatic compound transport system substrate-binding protein
MGGWFRKEINTIEDLKGLKFRIGGLAGSILAKLGVVPQQIAGGDVYASLEKGTIDAAEWVGPYDDEKLGFVKVAKYYYYPGWWEVGPTVGVYVNLEKWASLPAPYQSMLQAASAEANQWMSAKYDAVNPPALKRLVAAGAQLKAFPPEVMDACWKATNEVLDDVASKNAAFKKLYEHFTAFRNDQYLYTRWTATW